ncbi:MAG: hypothetical protein ACRDN9_07040 [Streptosporangiaceae bacterium]
MSGKTAERTAPAQVRLGPDEWSELTRSMRLLGLHSTSEALREGLRLLHREALETEAAKEIHLYYGRLPAPIPDAVEPVTQADLDAADESEW